MCRKLSVRCGFRWITALTALVVVAGMGVSPVQATFITPASVLNSSPHNDTRVVAQSFDGTNLDYGTNSGDSTFVEFDFGSPVTIDRVIAVQRNFDFGGNHFTQVTYTFSDDASFGGSDPTETIATLAGQATSLIYTLSTPRTAQYVRWDIDTRTAGASNNTGAMELLFLATPTGTSIVTGVSAIASFAPVIVPGFDFARGNAVNGVVGQGGTTAKEYASDGGGTNTFVDFDFGAETPIAGFDLIQRWAPADWVTSFDLIFSNNSDFSSPIDTKSFNISDVLLSGNFAPVSARYVRYDVTGVPGGANANGISEITFYAVPEPSSFAMLAVGMVSLWLLRRNR